MSLFGAMFTAVSGLTAQSAAFGNISDNIANSQSTGFKGVNTSFEDLLTTSNAIENNPGSVIAKPEYSNDVQGTVTQSTDPLALAISGAGFFATDTQSGVNAVNAPVFSSQTSYTRNGDFTMDDNGYLVNSTGGYLQGWLPNASGAIDQTHLQTIQVNKSALSPTATSTVSLSANLPATPTAGATNASDVTVYDSLGDQQTLTATWTQNSANNWTVAFSSPGNTGGGAATTIGSATVTFNSNTSGAAGAAPDGTIASITGDGANVVATGSQNIDDPATMSLACNFDGSPQNITFNIGNFGEATAVTQFAGTTYDERDINQDGQAAGGFTGISTESSGAIVANYNNGQSKIIAQVPVVTFTAPDALQRQDGQAFTADDASGSPIAQAAGSNTAGSLVTQSVESSNVDIASEFSKLIVTQQAYGANTKVVTTANTLLQETLDMKQ